MLKPSEFRCWIDNCIRDAQARGLPVTDIVCELADQLKRLLTRIEIKSLCKKEKQE